MENRQKSDKCELSPEATKSRREYYRTWRAKNRKCDKATKLRYWEKKAKDYYGEDYTGPEVAGELSRQAREVRRKYYAEYRKNNQETVNRAYMSYWEKKAKENIT